MNHSRNGDVRREVNSLIKCHRRTGEVRLSPGATKVTDTAALLRSPRVEVAE